MTPGFKNHIRNLENFRQTVENPESWYLLSTTCMKIHEITCHFWNHKLKFTKFLIFQTKSQFFFKAWIVFQCHVCVILLYFFSWNFLCCWQKQHIKMRNFRLATARIKIQSQFFFKLCSTLLCHETWLFCPFSSKSLYAMDKTSRWKCQFPDFWLLAWKLT